MKHLITTIFIVLLVISFNSYGQTSEKKNYFSIGGGKQCYNGDLGNSWFKPDEEWYGFVSIHYSRYVNKSFDVSLSATHGDYGHCQESDDPQFRPDGTEILNMLSRLTTGIVSVKYKLANGYVLKETAKLAPYIYVGGGMNNISEFWWNDKTRANTGYYTSLNGGAGIRYNFYKNLSFTYNLGLGYFTNDNIDKRVEGKNDMYMQHTFLLGINF